MVKRNGHFDGPIPPHGTSYTPAQRQRNATTEKRNWQKDGESPAPERSERRRKANGPERVNIIATCFSIIREQPVDTITLFSEYLIPHELSTVQAGEEEFLISKHKEQLFLYKKALEEATKKKVKEIYLSLKEHLIFQWT